MRSSRVVPLFALLAMFAPAAAPAQSLVSIGPYVGILLVDDDFDPRPGGRLEFVPREDPDPAPAFRTVHEVGNALLVGARVGVDLGDRWLVEASYGWAEFDVDSRLEITPGGEATLPPIDSFTLLETSLHLWETSLRYRLGSPPVRPFLTAGIGGATRQTRFVGLEDLPGFDDRETDTSVSFVVGVGATWNVAPRASIQGVVRDQAHACGDSCEEVGTLHDLEVSIGVAVDL